MSAGDQTGDQSGDLELPAWASDQMRALLAAAPTPVVGVRADGSVDYANAPAVELFGYEHGQLLGRHSESLLATSPHHEQALLRFRQMLDGTDRPTRLGRDMEMARADGTRFTAEVTVIPLDTPHGVRAIVTVRDLTQRQQHQVRMEELSRSYRWLMEMNQAILRAPDERTLFSETCRLAVDRGGYIGAWVAQVDEGGVVRRVAATGEPELEDFLQRLDVSLDVSVPTGRTPTAEALREGHAVFSAEYYAELWADLRGGTWADVLADERLGETERLALSYGIDTSASFPLSCGGRTVAVLSLYARRSDRFDDEMRSLLEAMSENVSFALERLRDAAELRSLVLQRQDLSRRLVAAQEEERARIAADVHDDSVQALAAADLRLGLVRRRLLEQVPHLAPDLERAQQTVADVTVGLRDLLFDLEPADEDTPLADLVREAAEHVFEDASTSWALEVADTWDGRSVLSQSDRSQALRIVKEALFNVRKHASATWVHLALVPGDRGVEFVVRDDGVGFDPEATPAQRGHRGLANIRDRAAVSGGWCRIERADPGTAVRFWLPYARG